jgi:hypothetical protein
MPQYIVLKWQASTSAFIFIYSALVYPHIEVIFLNTYTEHTSLQSAYICNSHLSFFVISRRYHSSKGKAIPVTHREGQ